MPYEKAGKHKPDMILMDIKLKSKKDGIETADEIFRKYKIPVIYLTAYSDEDTLERAKRTQPYGYIIKPFEEKEISGVQGRYKSIQNSLIARIIQLEIEKSYSKMQKRKFITI